MKVGVVGSGLVGATAAYALVMRGVGREIVLVDRNEARAAAEADDIRHAVPFAHPLEVRAGGYADLAGCRAVVLCAGRRPEARGDAARNSCGATRRCFARSCRRSCSTPRTPSLVVATNPVDVMTHLAARFAAQCGVAPAACSAPGPPWTRPASARLLGTHCGVDPHHVHAYVVGEHGDSEVLTWSLATVGGMPLEAFARMRGIDLSEAVRQDIDEKVRRAAYTIIGGKGATYYGIGIRPGPDRGRGPARPAVDPDRVRPDRRRARGEGRDGRRCRDWWAGRA